MQTNSGSVRCGGNGVSRRDLLIAGTSVGVTGLLPGIAEGAVPAAADAPKRRRSLRIGHLTDIHVQPEKRAGEGMIAALHHVQSLPDRPDALFLGGDYVMDAGGADKERTRVQWRVAERAFRDHLSLPVEHCIGNHDIFGINRMSKGRNPDEPEYGKRWAMDELELTTPYRSFDRAGWHFIVLDSTFPQNDSYTARLDETQFEWLQADLAKTPARTPILVLSHIPILGVSVFFDGDNEKTGNWVVPGAWMHIDARRIQKLFAKHPNVKVCLSGHIHLVDRVDYLGVSYLCNGAVCGGWWNGNYQECVPGYAVVDLYDDGTFENTYVPWGWKPEA